MTLAPVLRSRGSALGLAGLMMLLATSSALAQGRPDEQDGVIVDNLPPVTNWLYGDGGENLPGKYDPVLFVEPGWEYPYWMYVGGGRDQAQELWKSQDMVNWTIEVDDMRDTAGNLISTEGGTNFNWGRKGPDGKYYLYQSYRDRETRLYRGDTMDQLEYIGKVLDESDPGGFYDPSTGTWHMYFEAVPVSGSPSGDALGHATSPDGINWTVTKNPNGSQKLVLDVRDREWHTGDPDVIKIGDTYHMFIDNTVDHPNYRIAWATSDSPDGPFIIQEDAVTHWVGGDASVRYIEQQQKFYMYQEFRGDTGANYIGVGFGTVPSSGVAAAAAIDPATVAGMRLWLKDAQQNFDPGAGAFDAVWADSSGAGNDLVAFAGQQLSDPDPDKHIDAADAEPTLVLITEATTGKSFHAVRFADTANELMKTDLLGPDGDDASGEGQFTGLTMFTVCRIGPDAADSLARPYGVGSYRDVERDHTDPADSADFFNAANDATIRKDNGFVGGADEPLPTEQLFIRISRMDPDSDVDEWLHLAGRPLDLLLSRGESFTTDDDDFFLGDLRIDESRLTGDTFDIVEVIVFDNALSDAQIAGIDAYLAQKYAIPEPSSVALLGLGGLLLTQRRRATGSTV